MMIGKKSTDNDINTRTGIHILANRAVLIIITALIVLAMLAAYYIFKHQNASADYISNTEANTSVEYANLIFPKSNTELISIDKAKTLSKNDVVIAIAEIYARYGETFRDNDLTTHFMGYDWYLKAGDESTDEDGVCMYYDFNDLNETEMANVCILDSMYPGTQDPTVPVYEYYTDTE